MNTANLVARVTLLLYFISTGSLQRGTRKASAAAKSRTVLALKNLWSKTQALGWGPRRGVLGTRLLSLPYCYPYLRVPQAISGGGTGGLGDLGTAGRGRVSGRENVFSSAGQWLLSGSLTTTDHSYTELPSCIIESWNALGWKRDL